MASEQRNESSAATSYFTDRCMAIIDGNFMAPRCGLKLGHEGQHEPITAGTQTVSESPAARAWVNGLAFALPDKVTHMTGAQLRALPTPSIRDDADLFVIVPGDEDLLVQYDEVVPVVAREFFSVPRFINAG